MKNYQTSELEAADQLLSLLGIPGPYTLKEEIKILEVFKLARDCKLQGSLESCYASIKEVTNKIRTEIYVDRLSQNKFNLCRELYFLDWQDDLESFSLG